MDRFSTQNRLRRKRLGGGHRWRTSTWNGGRYTRGRVRAYRNEQVGLHCSGRVTTITNKHDTDPFLTGYDNDTQAPMMQQQTSGGDKQRDVRGSSNERGALRVRAKLEIQPLFEPRSTIKRPYGGRSGRSDGKICRWHMERFVAICLYFGAAAGDPSKFRSWGDGIRISVPKLRGVARRSMG